MTNFILAIFIYVGAADAGEIGKCLVGLMGDSSWGAVGSLTNAKVSAYDQDERVFMFSLKHFTGKRIFCKTPEKAGEATIKLVELDANNKVKRGYSVKFDHLDGKDDSNVMRMMSEFKALQPRTNGGYLLSNFLWNLGLGGDPSKNIEKIRNLNVWNTKEATCSHSEDLIPLYFQRAIGARVNALEEAADKYELQYNVEIEDGGKTKGKWQFSKIPPLIRKKKKKKFVRWASDRQVSSMIKSLSVCKKLVNEPIRSKISKLQLKLRKQQVKALNESISLIAHKPSNNPK